MMTYRRPKQQQHRVEGENRKKFRFLKGVKERIMNS